MLFHRTLKDSFVWRASMPGPFYMLVTEIQLVHNLQGILSFQNSVCPDAGKSTPHPHPCPTEAHLKGDSASFWSPKADALETQGDAWGKMLC